MCISAAHINRMTKTLLSFGHGYTARALGALLNEAGGWRIIGTTRDAAKAAALTEGGVDAVIWPGTDMAPALAEATHLLISAGPDGGGDPVLSALRTDIARAAVGAGIAKLARAVFIHLGHPWADMRLGPSTSASHEA